ncbi:MAG TPA: hypothetical protein VM576_05385 [Xanthomonadaceae bacterium]|nr:hypothetical protein [Xanthomonadaceae bacterium]
MTRRLLPLALALLALLPFLAGIHGPFLHDDWANLPLVKVGPFSWDAAVDVATRNSSGLLKRPLANLSFAANYWTTGFTPFWFKLTNLAIHAACGLLLYALGVRLFALLGIGRSETGRRFAALGAMALWLAHPLQVSTVLYVVQRMAQLSTLFVLLGVYLLVRWLGQAQRTWSGAFWTAAGMAGCGIAGLACKENAALLPLIAGVVFVAWRWRAAPTAGPLDPPSRGLLLATVVLPIGLACLFLIANPDFFLSGYAGRSFSFAERQFTEAAALWFYLRLFFLPWIPSMGLYHDDFPTLGAASPLAWAAIAAWVAILALAFRKRRQWPLFALAVLWYLAGHAMESSIFPLELLYEHRNYLSLAGPCLWLGNIAATLADRLPAFRRLGWLLPLLLLGGVTAHRAHTWSSDDLFAELEYRHHPDSFRALLGAAGRAASIGDYPRADELTRKIKQLRPNLIWPLVLDVSMQCIRPYPVDWTRIHERMHANGTLDRLDYAARDVTNRVISGQCDHLQHPQFNALLEDAYTLSVARDAALEAELFARYRGWMAKVDGDTDAMRLWWRRSSDANPSSVESLFDLAYEELNSGRLGATGQLVRELRQRTRQYGLHVGYRIDELAEFLRQAELAERNGPSKTGQQGATGGPAAAVPD